MGNRHWTDGIGRFMVIEFQEQASSAFDEVMKVLMCAEVGYCFEVNSE